jgi:hypothetical protein
MRKQVVVVGIVLVAVGFVSGVAVAQTQWLRNGRYYLPSRNLKTALEEILTEHRRDLDTLATADASLQDQIDTLSTNLLLHVNDTTSAHGYDARYVRTSDTTERQISGAISPNGGIVTGAGFTSVRNSTGVYTITFDTPFAGNTRAVVDVFDGAYMDFQGLGDTSMDIFIRDTGGNLVDQDWDFVVFGR